MPEASDRARRGLDAVAVRWVRTERVGEPRRALPQPDQVVPERDPGELADDPVARAYRDLFWTLGIDPTKQRPAGEALARRVAQGKGLPRVLPLVDAYNLASACSLVTFSAFDAAAIEGELVLDVLDQEAAFEPIGGEPTTLEKGRAVWRDDKGVVSAFLYRDGRRTAITEATEHALVVAGGPVMLAPRVLPDAFRMLESFVDLAGWRFLNGVSKVDL